MAKLTKPKKTNSALDQYKEYLKAYHNYQHSLKVSQEQIIALNGAMQALEKLHEFNREEVLQVLIEEEQMKNEEGDGRAAGDE